MSVKAIEAEVYIKSGVEADAEIGKEIIKTVYEEPVLESLEVVTNGTYEPEEGVDGYSDVTVSIPIYDGETEVEAESIDITLPTNGKIVPDDILVRGINFGSDFVIEGVFTAKETGTLVIDTKYEGNGFPKLVEIRPVSGMTNAEFLSSPYKFYNAVNTHILTKSNWTTPTYLSGGGVNASRAMTVYARSADYAITATSQSAYSQTDPQTTAAECLKFSDKRTMKIYAEGVDDEHHAVFAVGIKYKYRVFYSEPITIEPEEQNIFEGEFVGAETGVVTIDTGYEGDSFPKIIEITPKSGIFSDEFINAVLPYSICAFVTVKKTAAVPLYNGKSSDVYVSAYTYYNGSAFVGNYIGSAYICAQANPGYSASKVIRCSDNKTIKIFTADENSGESTFFPCSVVFKYRVVY